MAKRFFVDKDSVQIKESSINVIGEEVHHINVLRHKAGDTVIINEYEVEITSLSKDELVGRIISTFNVDNNKSYTLSLYQSYIKADKMEYVVQKAVELDIDNIVPFLSKNTVVKLDNKDRQKKQDRLNKISMEASKQCGRADIVEVKSVQDISNVEFLQELSKKDFVILAYEKSQSSLKKVLETIKANVQENSRKVDIAIVIGPEGGFDKKDIEVLEKIPNLYTVSLGKNILRAETASLNLISVINYELGEI